MLIFCATIGIYELSPCYCPLQLAAKKASNPLAETLVPLVLHDPAVLFSLLAFASHLHDANSGLQNGSATTLYYRLQAFQFINEALNDSRRATSDTILTSILFVSASDVS